MGAGFGVEVVFGVGVVVGAAVAWEPRRPLLWVWWHSPERTMKEAAFSAVSLGRIDSTRRTQTPKPTLRAPASACDVYYVREVVSVDEVSAEAMDGAVCDDEVADGGVEVD